MFKDMFRKTKYVTIQPASERKYPAEDTAKEQLGARKEIPDGLWVKCPKCGEVLYNKDLDENLRVCTNCRYHFRISARERIAFLVDEGSFEEWDVELRAQDPLEFPGYLEKLTEAQEKAQMPEGVLSGQAKIGGISVVLALNESNFMMGSMGSVAGEKITRAIERAIEFRSPLIIF